MKILILSTSNPFKAAGIVSLDLYNGLKGIEGNEVKMVVKIWDDYSDRDIIPMQRHYKQTKENFVRRFKHLLKRFNIFESKKNLMNTDYLIQDIDQSVSYYSTLEILNKIDFNPDFIFVLFTQNFLSYKNISELNLLTKAPVFQYLMDMAPFTGGCHYAWDCRGYTRECGKCPALFSNNPNDQTNRNWKFKKEYIKNTDITIVAASEWQWLQINQSSLFELKRKVKILSPTNSELFYTLGKIIARESLKIPAGKKIIFWGAIYPYEKRKGYRESIESFKILYTRLSKEERDNIIVMVAGDIDTNFKKYISFDVHHLGYLNYVSLATAYCAADVFLNASIEDSGPTMINQSIMCGTPVAAFEMGVALDLVKTEVTGYMAKLGDSNDLCNAIISILRLSETEYKKMSNNCRELALAECSFKKVAADFQKLMMGNGDLK